MRIPPDRVQIRPAQRSVKLPTILVRLGDGDVGYSGGVGGWEAVARPRHRPITVWRGPQNPLTFALPLLFDGWLHSDEGESVEADVRTLEKMAGLDKGDPEPPLLIIEGSLPHDESRAPSNRWVIADIAWGETIRRASDGHRVRQACVVTFLLHEEDARLARTVAPPRPRHETVHVRPGETWNHLAARTLGDKRLARRLARLNGGRSPDVAIRHRQVKVPTGAELATWRLDLRRG